MFKIYRHSENIVVLLRHKNIENYDYYINKIQFSGPAGFIDYLHLHEIHAVWLGYGWSRFKTFLFNRMLKKKGIFMSDEELIEANEYLTQYIKENA